MQLWRCFSWDEKSKDKFIPGSPLYVPTNLQGRGRFDIVKSDAVLYASSVQQSAIAEYLKSFNGRIVTQKMLGTGNGFVKAVASLELDDANIVNFVQPENMVKYKISPKELATNERSVSQNVAQKMFDSNVDGIQYWSSLEAQWDNLALFLSRVKGKIKVREIAKLELDSQEVKAAAKFLGVSIVV